MLNSGEFPDPRDSRSSSGYGVHKYFVKQEEFVLKSSFWTWYNWQSHQQGSRLVGAPIGTTYTNERPSSNQTYPRARCALICLLRACDMNTCCVLGPSESPEAAVGRSQVSLPGWLLLCFDALLKSLVTVKEPYQRVL